MYKKFIFAIIAVVIILTGVSGILGYIWQNQDTATYNKVPFVIPPRPEINNNEESKVVVPPLPPVPETQIVNSYNGQIIEIAANKLVLSTNYGNKTVNIDEQTIFEKLFIPRFPQLPPLPGQTADEPNVVPKPQKITLSDLTAGEKVEVYAEENIKNQEQFTADKISLVVKLDN